MNKQEAKVTVFFFTTLAVGPLVGALVRFITVGHLSNGTSTALVVGLIFLVVDILMIGLQD